MLYIVYEHKTEIISTFPQKESEIIAIYKDIELAEMALETKNGCIVPIMSDL